MQTKSLDGTPGTPNPYVEYQRFAAWVYVVAVAIPIMCTIFISVERDGNLVTPPFVPYFSLVLLLFLLDILVLRTTVKDDALRVQLGLPIPFFWKRIGIDSIRAARVVTYRPFADAGGWGLRFGRFDDDSAIYWSARGNLGVLIETEKRDYIIGSQDPESLHAAIEHVREKAKNK